MGVARGLERRLERLVDGLAARLFRGRIHPVELGSMLVREADLALVTTPAGPRAPNAYRITMGGDPVESDALEAAEAELARFVDEAAAERGWRLDGPSRVVVSLDPDHRPGEVTIAVGFEAGPLQPWAVLHPLDPHGEEVRVRHIRCIVGRSVEADARISADTVSRIHALVWQEAGAAWIADLASSNGTYLNGEEVTEPTAIVAGDIVAFGEAGYTVREPS